MHFKVFQRQDLARAALHDGLILSWDTGLGKTLALFVWALLKVGFIKVNGEIQPNAPVLIIAPGDLHKQIADEGWRMFKIRITPIDSQDAFNKLARLPGSPRLNIGPDGKPVIAPGFYITSYTQLTTNGVASVPDPEKWDPRALLEFLALPTGDHVPAVFQGAILEKGKPGAKWETRPEFKTVSEFYAWRHLAWNDEYHRLTIDPNGPLADLATAVQRERDRAGRIGDDDLRDRAYAEIHEAERILSQLLTTRPNPTFASLARPQQDFVIRAFAAERIEAYEQGIGTHRDYAVDPAEPEGAKRRIRCVYSPSMAELSYNAFKCVAIDEGVKMKGEETLVGKGVRLMEPDYRLVLTATPVKNRLPDIFRLAWWAAGGRSDAHPRWPYMDDSSERAKFAETFMVSERNVTKEEKARDRGESTGGRYKKLTAEVCNVHRLWKLFGPVILRRRKQDAGEDIVPRIRKVIRCEMGTLQQKVYQYHLQAEYRDRNGETAIGAQLQALRMAASDPSSEHLMPQPNGAAEPCPCKRNPKCAKCKGEGYVPLPHRSGQAYIPKLATALTIIQEILERKEQVVVFSAFNDPLDNLGDCLTQATVRHVKLDGRVSQKQRGKLAGMFKQGRMMPTEGTASLSNLPIPVMLAGVECMAEGHSFHLANNVILIAYSWAYDKFKQALDRVHRMTSTKPVNVYVILCTGTIDAKLESLVQDKGDAAELVLDGRLIGERMEEVNLAELLRIAHREFDDKTKTIDEALLQGQWPTLRHRLEQSMRDWDEGAGVPIAFPLTTNLRTVSRIPSSESTAPATEPRFDMDAVQTPVVASDAPWKNRMAGRAERLSRCRASSDLWANL